MEILENYSLQKLNTFGVDQSARYFSVVNHSSELSSLFNNFEHPYLLGGGSNILLTKDLDRLVIRNNLNGMELVSEDKDFVWVEVKSGENWHHFVRWAVGQGWGGVENLSLIPGTVGAAPIQNIGAYGVEIKDVLTEVHTMEVQTGKLVSFINEECQFAYRHSIFKTPEYINRYFILSITLKLAKNPEVNTRYADVEKKLIEYSIKNPGIADIHRAIIEIRLNKLPDPSLIGNAGSFFKNPVLSIEQYENLKFRYPQVPHYPAGMEWVKVPAGWLIDQAGWKGKNIGAVGCYEKQALVIINRGGATGSEIWSFSQMIKKDVHDKFGILLEPEINIW